MLIAILIVSILILIVVSSGLNSINARVIMLEIHIEELLEEIQQLKNPYNSDSTTDDEIDDEDIWNSKS